MNQLYVAYKKLTPNIMIVYMENPKEATKRNNNNKHPPTK